MTAPVLKDLMGNEFTVGDRVVYASTNGIRVGRVDWIKETPTVSGDTWYVVYIDMSEHHDKTGPAKMRAAKVGYQYRYTGLHNATYHHFLKVS